MARHARRLIAWILGGALALALLGVLAVLALVWLVDPNSFRARIAQSASEALGRPVQLGGDLHWHIGWNIAIESEDGSIANAPGFGATPFAHWQRLQFGLGARALMARRIVIDRIEFDGLQVNLQRNPAGEDNWQFAARDVAADPGESVALQVGALRLRNSQLTFTDATAVWKLGELALDVDLPSDLNASQRELRDIELRARLSGGPLPAAGVPVGFEAASLRHDASSATLELPAFEARWSAANLSGNLRAVFGTPLLAQGKLSLRVASVRALLADLGVTPPPMADPKTLGKLEGDGAMDLKGSSISVTDLRAALDDTRLNGTVTVVTFTPFALRFDLTGDSIDFDRYLEPADYKGEPFELPLAQLKALNVQGALRLNSATVAGGAAKDLTIKVE